MGQSGEDRVVDYLTSHGLRPRRFTKAEMRKGKTPDFRVYQGRTLAFYCEVKTKEDWLLPEALKAPPGAIFGGLRDDFTYFRLTEYIHTAAQQFAAVNPAEEYPNVLAIVANDPDVLIPRSANRADRVALHEPASPAAVRPAPEQDQEREAAHSPVLVVCLRGNRAAALLARGARRTRSYALPAAVNRPPVPFSPHTPSLNPEDVRPGTERHWATSGRLSLPEALRSGYHGTVTAGQPKRWLAQRRCMFEEGARHTKVM